MTAKIARQRFSEIASRGDAPLDLASAALWIAAEAQPGLDVPGYCARLESLADAIRPELHALGKEAERVERLNRYLFDEQKFCGNRDEYYDPRNSYLNAVLDRRLGIPISLAVVWISLARRLELDAYGVGFPGHFLIRVEAAEPIFVDAFGGNSLSEEDCRELLRRMAGPGAHFDRSLLSAIPDRSVLARMLRNLKQIHLDQSHVDSALGCMDRILLLEPNSPLELRERGLLLRELECWLAARSDLEQYAELVPGAPDAAQIADVIADLRRRTRRLH